MENIKKKVPHCLNCLNIHLDEVYGKEFEHVETNELIRINGLYCKVCGCIHYLQDSLLVWQYLVDVDERDSYSKARMLKSDNEINKELVIEVKKLLGNKIVRENLQVLEEIIEENTDPIDIINSFRNRAAATGKKLNNRFKQIVKDVISESFKRGAQLAQQQVNIVKPTPKPKRYVLTPKDKRIIQTLKETDFSLIKTRSLS